MTEKPEAEASGAWHDIEFRQKVFLLLIEKLVLAFIVGLAALIGSTVLDSYNREREARSIYSQLIAAKQLEAFSAAWASILELRIAFDSVFYAPEGEVENASNRLLDPAIASFQTELPKIGLYLGRDNYLWLNEKMLQNSYQVREFFEQGDRREAEDLYSNFPRDWCQALKILEQKAGTAADFSFQHSPGARYCPSE